MKKVLATLAMLGSLCMSSLAFAAITPEDLQLTKTAIQQQRENFKSTATALLGEKIEDRCSLATQRITLLIARFENNKSWHVNRYQFIKDKIQAIIANLINKGFDTAKLQADLQVLDEKIKLVASDYTIFIDALRATEQYACGQSEGQYKEALKAAKEKLTTVKADILAVRNYYQGTIRPDIKALKDQKPIKTPIATVEPTPAS